MRAGLVAAVLAGVFSSACEARDDRASSDHQFDTLPNGRVFVSNADRGAHDLAGGLRLVEDLRLGSGPAGTGPDAFGDVVSLAASRDGVLYVADRLAREIVVFDETGTFVRRMGRRGDGPGEFRHLLGVDVAWQEPGRLWVAEAPYLHVLDETGVPAASPFRGLPALGGLDRDLRLDANGFAYLRKNEWDRVSPLSAMTYNGIVLKYGIGAEEEVAAVDSLQLGQWTETNRVARRRTVGGADVTEVETLPMEPRTLWAVAPAGTLWLAATSEHRLHEVTLAGDTLRTVELRRPPAPLAGAERDSLADASGFPADELPPFRPAMDRVDVAGDGLVWVRNRLRGRAFAWDVFDACGRYLGNVAPGAQLDRSPMAFGEGGTVYGVVKDEMDIEYVVRMTLRLPDGSRLAPSSC